MPLEPVVTPLLEADACAHMAIVLREPAELHGVLASFYGLAVRRGGWIAHRSLAGEADLDRELLTDAGLDVAALERAGQLAVVEFDPTEDPAHSTAPWRAELDRALRAGYSGLWYSRFAVGQDEYALVEPFEAAWDRDFADAPVITLCPYFVRTATGSEDRSTAAQEHHRHVLVTGADGIRVRAGSGVGAAKSPAGER